MKIITRGKRISKYSKVSGLMTVDVTNDIFWLKLDFDSGSGQIIVELSEFEVAQIINAGLKDVKIVAACKRQGQSPCDYDYFTDLSKLWLPRYQK